MDKGSTWCRFCNDWVTYDNEGICTKCGNHIINKNNMKLEKAKLSTYDIEALAIALCNLDEDEVDGDINKIDDALVEQYNIDFDALHKLACVLLPLVTVAESPLTKTIYKGFGLDGMWLAKMKIEEN